MKATLADIVREHGAEYVRETRGSCAAERKILRDIEYCRTARMGGHRYRCAECGNEELAYNSCRNRHCPRCLGSKTGKWLSARVSELLPVPYYHCVFTLPAALRSVALGNKIAVYNLLFTAAAEALQKVAANPKHLGATLGFFGILHTWTQTLEFHPHVHFVVPGGGLCDKRWVAKKGKRFFLPVKVLSRVFRGVFIDALKRDYNNGKIHCRDFDATLTAVCRTDWVVYCKPPFAGPHAVLKYLSRYTHRIAISNRRILSLKNGTVSFLARGARRIRVPAVTFLKRFLLHRVPLHFTRIRHFGFLANKGRKAVLAFLQSILKPPPFPLPQQKPWLLCSCGASSWVRFAIVNPCNSS